MIFFRSFVRKLLDDGHIVTIATNESLGKTPVPECYRKWGCEVLQISCSRSPISLSNLRAIHELREIVSSQQYDIVHCHTPVASVCTRLACQEVRKSGVRIVYTAHGFHFYKKAPLKNWLIFFPVEWVCSWITDTLITITLEDYDCARRHLHAKSTFYVPGVGVDTVRFKGVNNTSRLRRELGLDTNDQLILSVGELNKNKNHQVIVRSLVNLPKTVHYAIAGEGELSEFLASLADDLDIANRLHLLGYRNDIPSLMAAANVYVLPSFREGLNVSLMEAMACGLPCVCRSIRGNKDLIDEGEGGILVTKESPIAWSEALKHALILNINEVAEHNKSKIVAFSDESINEEMIRVYDKTIA